MDSFCFYLLKSSGVLVLFFICYQLLLRKETLFHFNRIFLLSGVLLSFALPFVYIIKTVTKPLLQAPNTATANEIITQHDATGLTPYLVIVVLYVTGALFLLIKLCKQGIELNKIIKEGKHVKTSNLVHVHNALNKQPFSFFNTIVYNPTNHTEAELTTILSHEEVHAKQLHSLDVLLIELVLILQWFNPIAWSYKTALKQNLEFIADTDNKHIKSNRREYQYVLLKQAVKNHQLSIVNPFFNSSIKKRIVMINQKQSHQLNALKSLFILPLLAFFLLSFNVKKVYTISLTEQVKNLKNSIELVIDKNTTDELLAQMKANLAKENFAFSYTVVRNEEGEIKNVSLEISGGNKTSGQVSSRYNSVSDHNAIAPIFIFIDTGANTISIGNAQVTNNDSSNGSKIWVTGYGKNPTEKIIVKGSSGEKEIIVDRKDNKKTNGSILIESDSPRGNKHIGIKKIKKNGPNKEVIITTNPSEEHDIEIIEKTGTGFIYVDTESGNEPLIYLDGKLYTKNINDIAPSTIKAINVLKGNAAVEKYGKNAGIGVIEITTLE